MPIRPTYLVATLICLVSTLYLLAPWFFPLHPTYHKFDEMSGKKHVGYFVSPKLGNVVDGRLTGELLARRERGEEDEGRDR